MSFYSGVIISIETLSKSKPIGNICKSIVSV
jgi:hypothetical protein